MFWEPCPSTVHKSLWPMGYSWSSLDLHVVVVLCLNLSLVHWIFRVRRKHQHPAIFSVYSALQHLHVAITLVLFRWVVVGINWEMALVLCELLNQCWFLLLLRTLIMSSYKCVNKNALPRCARAYCFYNFISCYFIFNYYYFYFLFFFWGGGGGRTLDFVVATVHICSTCTCLNWLLFVCLLGWRLCGC